MTTYKNVRNFTKAWAKKTYAEGVADYAKAAQDPDALEMVQRVMKRLNIADKPMTGDSCQGLPRIDEGRTTVRFSEVIDELVDTFLTPASYVAEIALRSRANRPESEVAGETARALRAFPSFLREMDLGWKVGKECEARDLGALACVADVDADIDEHTDVFLSLAGRDYRLWSYLDSARGLANVKSKLSGARGEVPAGVHVLCPIDITRTCDEVRGWRFYPERGISEIVDVIENGAPLYDYGVVRDDLDRCVREVCLIEKA